MDAPPAAERSALLDGRVSLWQPSDGYRAAIDPVLLAAAAPGGARRILDMGAGTGAVMLCALARLPRAHATGLEILPDHAALAAASLALNGWEDRGRVEQGDVADPPSCIVSGGYDAVLTNPPYNDAGRRPPHNRGRSAAYMEETPLPRWIDGCLRKLETGGVFAVIHRAERLSALLAALQGRAGGIGIIPLWPKPGVAAKRVIVRARKGARAPLTVSPGLVLHAAEGGYTPEADAVLRAGWALDRALAAQGAKDRRRAGAKAARRGR